MSFLLAKKCGSVNLGNRQAIISLSVEMSRYCSLVKLNTYSIHNNLRLYLYIYIYRLSVIFIYTVYWEGCGRKGIRRKLLPNIQMRYDHESIPDRSRSRLPTIASGVARQGTGGSYATAEHGENNSRKRGGRRVKRQRELRKGRSTPLRVGTLTIGTITGRGRELADLLERRNVDILCLQETKWKGSEAKNIGGGCKLFYNGANGRRNGIGIVVREKLVESFMDVKRVSDRLMAMKLEVKGSILNIVSVHAP